MRTDVVYCSIFLWRQPSASVYYSFVSLGMVLSRRVLMRRCQMFLGWFILGLLPARYFVRSVGLLVGVFFWHAVPVIAVIPGSELFR